MHHNENRSIDAIIWYSLNHEDRMEPIKAKLNLEKHGIGFEEAASAMTDPMAVTGADPDHSAYEERYITFGISARNRLLVLSHTGEGETIRLISARKASKGERKIYEEG
jgi:uncharacterized protein